MKSSLTFFTTVVEHPSDAQICNVGTSENMIGLFQKDKTMPI